MFILDVTKRGVILFHYMKFFLKGIVYVVLSNQVGPKFHAVQQYLDSSIPTWLTKDKDSSTLDRKEIVVNRKKKRNRENYRVWNAKRMITQGSLSQIKKKTPLGSSEQNKHLTEIHKGKIFWQEQLVLRPAER